MDLLAHDVTFALRLLWRDRGFALTAVSTLALCIGANAAIFAVVNSVLLKPLPIPGARELVILGNQYPNSGVGEDIGWNSSVPDYFDRLAGMPGLDEQAFLRIGGQSAGEGTTAERLTAMSATPSLFALVQTRAAVGRTFLESEGEPGNERKVILSDEVWDRLYGRATTAIGQPLRLNGVPHEIVGVMPKGFTFIDPEVRLWIPAAFTAAERDDERRHANSYTHIGRLAPGATIAQAQSQVDAINAANLERFPALRTILTNAGFRTKVRSLQEHITGSVRPTLVLLWSGVAVVLLIGCVNIANLMLIRSTVRARELVTRTALGAPFGRLVRQLLTESLVLTSIGGALGLILGTWAIRSLGLLDVDQLPRGSEVTMDGTVVLFTTAITAVVGLAIGALTLLALRRRNLASSMREEGRTGTSSRGARFVRHALVTAQVGLAFVLLIGAGLLLASFERLTATDPGFRPSGLVTGWLSLPTATYPDEIATRVFAARLEERLAHVQGLERAGLSDTLPMGESYNDSVILAEGHQMQPGESVVSPDNISAGPGYFETMGIRLERGRFFDATDTDQSARVAIVDRSLARHFWGDADPIGRRLVQPVGPDALAHPTDENTRKITVVGVVADVRLRDLASARGVGTYYFPLSQSPSRRFAVVARAPTAPAAAIAALRREVAALDAGLPLYDVRSMSERVQRSLTSRRTPMILAVGFGVAALLLSAIGLYGILTYLVTHRRREIGIRMALGSSPREVMGLVVGEATRVVAVGLAAGLGGAALLSRALESQLYGVSALDPVVLASVVALFTSIAVVACLLPARRATRVNPVTVLGGD
ncbi:MAG: ABC transporter permease [Vicinamibacterales bacterium]